jgi:riboflavin kinase, archaea type
MILNGKIQSGKGDFSFWLEKLEPYYTRITGLKLFPGTLNVHLIHQSYFIPTGCLRLEKEEYGGQVSVSMVPCKIFDRKAFILRTDVDDGKYGDPPEKILEIATDVKLREIYNLKDGDIVEVEIPDSP